MRNSRRCPCLLSVVRVRNTRVIRVPSSTVCLSFFCHSLFQFDFLDFCWSFIIDRTRQEHKRDTCTFLYGLSLLFVFFLISIQNFGFLLVIYYRSHAPGAQCRHMSFPLRSVSVLCVLSFNLSPLNSVRDLLSIVRARSTRATWGGKDLGG